MTVKKPRLTAEARSDLAKELSDSRLDLVEAERDLEDIEFSYMEHPRVRTTSS